MSRPPRPKAFSGAPGPKAERTKARYEGGYEGTSLTLAERRERQQIGGGPKSTPASRAENARRGQKKGAAARRERARGPERLPDPTTSDRQYSDVETIVARAAEQYRQERGKPFLTLSEYLDVLRRNGWLNEQAILATLAGKAG